MNWSFTKRMHQLGLIVFLNEYTEVNQGQLSPYRLPLPKDWHLQAPAPWISPPPLPYIPYSLENEREIKKQLKLLALKKVNERIHIPSEKCLVIQTYGIR